MPSTSSGVFCPGERGDGKGSARKKNFRTKYLNMTGSCHINHYIMQLTKEKGGVNDDRRKILPKLRDAFN
jgi:hypothetical protein